MVRRGCFAVWAAVCLCVLLAMAGCGNGGGNADKPGTAGSSPADSSGAKASPSAAAAAPAEISVFKFISAGQTFLPDSELEKMIEQETGIQLNYEVALDTEYDKKLSLKVTSGDVPDISWTYYPNRADHNKLVSEGVFLPLDDLLPKFPKLQSLFNEQTWNALRNPKDGKIYGIPWLQGPGGNGLAIRKDWLDKLGLQEPKTLDEFIEVLIAFRDRDPDGNGKNDTIPMTVRSNLITQIYSYFTLFGVNPGWTPDPADPNKLLFGLVQPNAKEAIKSLKSLRDQGLFDPNWLIDKQTGLDRYKAGNVGAILVHLNIFRQFPTNEPTKDSVILDPITNNGNIWRYTYDAYPMYYTNQISAKSKNPEAALRYLEYQLIDGLDKIMWGVEGKTYTVENGVKAAIPNEERDPQYNNMVGLELTQPPNMLVSPERFLKFVNKDIAAYIDEFTAKYDRNSYYSYLRQNLDLPIYSEKSAELDQIIAETYSKMLLDSKADIDKLFDEMVANWSNAGGAALTEEINTVQTDKSLPPGNGLWK